MKERAYFDLSKIDPEVRSRVLRVTELANKKDKGDKVDLKNILEYSIGLIRESHVEDIQRKSLSEWDVIKLEFDRYLNKSQVEISLPEYILKRFKKEIK